MTNKERLITEYEEQLKLLLGAKEIVLYGNSVFAPIMEVALKDIAISGMPRVFDRGKFTDGQEIKPGIKRVIILCGMREKTRNSMRTDAKVVFPGDVCFDPYAIYYKWITECIKRECDHEVLADTIVSVRAEKAVHNIDSISTSFCNLNCKECSNGIQFRKNKKTISIEKQLSSIEKITEIMPISYCNIQGGEPLTDIHLAERLTEHAHNSRIAFFSVATNGTMVPRDDVMKAMRKAGAMFRISDYGELSSLKDELVEKAKQQAVPVDVYHRAESWLSCGDLSSHGRSEDENKKIAQTCHFGTNCLMVYDGDLYCCCRTLFADAKGIHNPDTEANVIHLLDDGTAIDIKHLNEIIEGRELYRMCDYCDNPMKKIGVAEQMKS